MRPCSIYRELILIFKLYICVLLPKNVLYKSNYIKICCLPPGDATSLSGGRRKWHVYTFFKMLRFIKVVSIYMGIFIWAEWQIEGKPVYSISSSWHENLGLAVAAKVWFCETSMAVLKRHLVTGGSMFSVGGFDVIPFLLLFGEENLRIQIKGVKALETPGASKELHRLERHLQWLVT